MDFEASAWPSEEMDRSVGWVNSSITKRNLAKPFDNDSTDPAIRCVSKPVPGNYRKRIIEPVLDEKPKRFGITSYFWGMNDCRVETGDR